MLTQKKHLTLVSKELLENHNVDDLDGWFKNIEVSIFSKFDDVIWRFEGAEAYRKEYLTIDWNKKLENGKLLQDYPSLFQSIKRCVFLMQTTLEVGIAKKPLTQTNAILYFRILVNWMLGKGIARFDLLTKEDVSEYKNFVFSKKNKKGESLKEKKEYFSPIRYLITYKDYLNDKIVLNLSELNLENAIKIKQETVKTKAIPNETVEKVLENILPIIVKIYDSNLSLKDLFDNKLFNSNRFATLCNHINAMCFFVLALYTGMRVSELISLKKGSVKIEDGMILIQGKLFKTVKDRRGRLEAWACGLNNENNYAYKAIQILEKLTPKDYENLFFKYWDNKFINVHTSTINPSLKYLLQYFNIDWNITTHQFRRTFAKLIGTTDKTNLLALQQHFKHASISMTSYYVGEDLELIEMISEEKKIEIAIGLNQILASNNLAGKLGEKIAKTNMKFRGVAGEKLRKDYIDSLINNSDLIVVPHEYGFCIYQPEQARCKGEQKNIGLNTCVKCNNFTVSNKHKVFWLNRIEQYEEFKEQITELPNQSATIEELIYNINEAKQIIKLIKD